MSDGINVHADGSDVQSVCTAKKRGRYKNLLALPNTYLCGEYCNIPHWCDSQPLPIHITWAGWLELHKGELGWGAARA
jgi:hypothetical protein